LVGLRPLVGIRRAYQHAPGAANRVAMANAGASFVAPRRALQRTAAPSIRAPVERRFLGAPFFRHDSLKVRRHMGELLIE
jgi:hypothetical protein